ncbi:Mcp1p SCDLUD_002082 [Saccharomycodes ludwigii]|uniref:Mcp1p n=1 Tax=Saccharomycodes ludwigii TaxID=36035 RepID=UPI001E83C5FA|nr:hypothetical protein SCDLUD_002082 [Saccharomycodes ludwigii]KAH3902265.1 hypothetical protein SCDLUD_002082 [Saccharomycodes ludwigii]
MPASIKEHPMSLKEVEPVPITSAPLKMDSIGKATTTNRYTSKSENSNNKGNIYFKKKITPILFKSLNYLHKYSVIPFSFYASLHLTNVIATPIISRSALLLTSYSSSNPVLDNHIQVLDDVLMMVRECTSFITAEPSILYITLGVHVISGIILRFWRRYRRSKFIIKNPNEQARARKKWRKLSFGVLTGYLSVPFLTYHIYLMKFSKKLSNNGNIDFGIIHNYLHNNNRITFGGKVLIYGSFIGIIGCGLYHIVHGWSRYFCHNKFQPQVFKSTAFYTTWSLILSGILSLFLI